MLQANPTPTAAASLAPAAGDRAFFGHPRGLATLFFTEMWERFSYYGMRAILTLFMVAAVADGGLGLSTQDAAIVYGLYTSLVFLLPLVGGWLADNFLGMRRAILYGGIVIMTGHILLAFHSLPTFYSGLGCIVLGTGLLKPNISAVVGQLYSEEDTRRDSGFSIFYMGINLGAFSAPLLIGFLAQSATVKGWLSGAGLDPTTSWHWGFGAAAVGMFCGLVQYVMTGRHLGTAGLVPGAAATAEGRARAQRNLGIGALVALLLAGGLTAWITMKSGPLTKPELNAVYTVILFGAVGAFFVWLFASSAWTPRERRRLVIVAVLFAGSCVFWSVFEQAGNTLTLFADKETRNQIFGLAFPSSWWQSVNALFIVLLAPVFAALWTKLGDFDRSSMLRFSIGILLVGLSFAILVGGARAAEGDALASPVWLLTVYFLHTIGELLLSPVGLSSMTKFAPQRVQGLMLGVWFASISVGTFLGSQVAGQYENYALTTIFAAVAGGAIAMAVVMAILIRPVSKLVDAKG
jgi:POT family proton-dependent oligopeptide transporter